MSWSIHILVNNVKISSKCAKDLFNAQAQAANGEQWSDASDVVNHGTLNFNPDNMEFMDFVSNEVFQDVLKKNKVKGDICFGSLEGDDAGSFWGYRFDGKGGMKTLDGKLTWEPKTPRP